MELHLYWSDNNWKKTGGVANNYNLVVDFEKKTYYEYVNPFYGYKGDRHIEVKKKQDIKDYIRLLDENGFTKTEIK